jgi:hypothetical protein
MLSSSNNFVGFYDKRYKMFCNLENYNMKKKLIDQSVFDFTSMGKLQ